MRVSDARTNKRLFWLAIAGATPPAFFIVVSLIWPNTFDSRWFLLFSIFLWPTEFQMMAVSGSTPMELVYWGVFAISAICNVFLFVAVGFTLCWVLVDLLWRGLFKKTPVQ